eukprot:COSAG06_NODE_4462_length_4235_cov_16.637881_5_plen_20_part_01
MPEFSSVAALGPELLRPAAT